MKKGFYSILAVLTLAGCQTETFNSTSHKDSGVFTATIEDAFGGESKTSLDSDGNIRWKQGDQVSIFVGSTLNEQYQVTDDSDGKTEATMSKVTSDVFVAGTEMDSNVALYPYTPAASIAKNSGAYTIDGIVIPADQDYTAESFGNGAFPMVAVTGSASDRNLRFKNIFGGLKLQLKGTATISSISVTGNNGEILCGAAQLSASSSQAPSISFTDGTAGTVTLYCGQGVALNEETATSFVIALPPVTMTAGFTVRVRDTAGWQMEINTDKSQTITRSTLLKMPSVTYEGTVNIAAEPVDLGLSVKWAAGNLCDNGLCVNPWDYGDYYAWGETESKSDYMRSTYLWGNGTESDKFTKYCSDSYYGDNGFTDTKFVLDADDDVARVKLGDKWRMPVYLEWKELVEQCTWTWFENYHGTGVNGMLFVGPNGNSIFLPAAGRRYYESLNYAGVNGCYWSSSLAEGLSSGAAYMDVSSSSSFGALVFFSFRCMGESVRPVYGDDKVFVNEISFTNSPVSAVVGESVKLQANVSPSDAYDKSLTWRSSDESIATVDQSGMVTAKSKGEATITATANDGSGVKAECEVEVRQLVTDISLDNTYLALEEGKFVTLVATVTPDNASDKSLTWTSSNASVAAVDANGKVTAFKAGAATITATANDGSGKYAECSIYVKTPEAVDLGLPSGLKWATCNLCENGFVSSPEEYGDYYAWAETEPYYSSLKPLTWKSGKTAGYNWSSYKWCKGSYSTLTKYCSSDYPNYWAGSGSPDNKTVLEAEDDVACVKLGGKWRMPTVAEWEELIAKCIWTWKSKYNGTGVNGWLVTGPNGNSIFLPAAGERSVTNLGGVGSNCLYWSSSLNTYYPYNALYVNFSSDELDRSSSHRCYGRSVRPVSE